MSKPLEVKLKHADGTEVTAQEAYDAFMNTRVLIAKKNVNTRVSIDNGENTYEAISMVWYDNNSAQIDPTNVGYVKLSYVTIVSGAVVINGATAGDSSLVPNQHG